MTHKIISIVFVSLALTSKVYSADFYVTEFSDVYQESCSDNCSLRGAIETANNLPGKDRIFLSSGEYQIEIEVPMEDSWGGYSQSQVGDTPNDKGDFDITDDLEIHGTSAVQTIVNGNHISRVFHIEQGDVLLKDLTITRGRGNGGVSYGGGIQNDSTLTLSGVVLRENGVGSWNAAIGGGISNNGTLNIYKSKLINNGVSHADDSTAHGGGIFNAEGAVLTVRDTLFLKNTSISEGGEGGGLYNRGTADVRRVLFAKNRLGDRAVRGGSAVANTGSGKLKIVSSSFYANEGGDEYWAGFAIVNVTDNNNKNPEQELSMTNVSIVMNTQGGLYTNNRTYMKNVLIADNFTTEFMSEDPSLLNCHLDFSGGTWRQYVAQEAVLTNRYPRDCRNDLSILDPHQSVISEVKLIDLTQEELQSLELYSTSEAIDRGVAPCPHYDQDGNMAPVDGDNDGVAECDIGASEWQPEQ